MREQLALPGFALQTIVDELTRCAIENGKHLSVAMRVHGKIVKVGRQIFSDLIREHVIHQTLECCWRVAQSKRHHIENKKAFVREERGFLAILSYN